MPAVDQMDVRDLVRIKKGAGGLDPPLNVGILLDRDRDGKDHVAILFTVNGRLRVRWDRVKESTGFVYQGDKTDERSMSEFIRDAIRRLDAKNILKLDPQAILDTLRPFDLWTSVTAYLEEANRTITETSPRMTPEEIARVHFDPMALDPRQIRAVEKVLSSCDGPHEPYFKRVDVERKAGYVPYPPATMEAVEAHSRDLESLRSCFVRWEDAQTEDGRAISHPVALSEDISTIRPEGGLAEELERICSWGRSFLEIGRWPEATGKRAAMDITMSPVGLAGTPVRRVRKFDLERFLGFFFKDLPMSRSDDLASNILLTLLKLRRITWREASELVVRYKIASGAQKFHRDFPQAVMDRSRMLPGSVLGPDLDGRTDLRGLETYTIDPVDAKDFDDAVSVVAHDGGWKVYVHIADVTHYVRPDDPIDSEARFRATSVYLPTGVLPMLPPKLSEDLCSLREGSDRLAVTAEISLSSDLAPRGFSFHQSVIRVRRNLSYDLAEGYIKEGMEPFSTLDRISQGLRARCRRLDLRTPERRVRFEGENAISASLKRATPATILIEELMVLANECASEFLESRSIRTAFRVHPIPERDGLERFNAACRVLGMDISLDGEWASARSRQGNDGQAGGGEEAMLKALMSGGKLSIGSLSSKVAEREEGPASSVVGGVDKERMDRALDEFNAALEKVHALPDEWMRDLLSATLLRSMPRAFYSVDNIGHFGLRSRSYCHFTSPIRRYADDLVHRAIKAVLAAEGNGPEVPWGVPSEEEVSLMTGSINDMSDDAESWERQMVDVAQATRMAMMGRDGAFSGRITSIAPAACYVTFDGGLTEGRLPIRAMSRYRLTPDPDGSRVMLVLGENMDQDLHPELMRAISSSGGEIVAFRLGDRVDCSIHAVSIAEGRLELSLRRRNGSESIIP